MLTDKDSSPSSNERPVLLGILVIAVILRAISLDNSLWYDEIVTMVNSVQLPLHDLLTDFSSFNNHPFYSLQAKLTVGLFGDSSWALRLPAYLFGVASLAAMWFLLRPVCNVNVTHVATLLLCVSYHHIWFSQNARGYTEMMFWCLLSTIFFRECLLRPSRRAWTIYALLVAAGIYTHLTASVFFAAQGLLALYLLLAPRSRLATDHYPGLCSWGLPVYGYLLAGLITLVLYSPSFVHIFNAVMHVSEGSSKDVMQEYQSPIWAALEVIKTISIPGPLTSIVGLTILGLTGIGMVRTYRSDPLLPILFVLHIVLMLVLLLSLSMRIWPRFFFVDAGFILLFVCQGVFSCCIVIRNWFGDRFLPQISHRHLFYIASTLMVVISLALMTKNYRHPKQDFDGSVAYLDQVVQNHNTVATLDLAATPFKKYYGKPWREIHSSEDIVSFFHSHQNARLIAIFPYRMERKYEQAFEQLEGEIEVEKRFRGTLGDGDIVIYRSKAGINSVEPGA